MIRRKRLRNARTLSHRLQLKNEPLILSHLLKSRVRRLLGDRLALDYEIMRPIRKKFYRKMNHETYQIDNGTYPAPRAGTINVIMNSIEQLEQLEKIMEVEWLAEIFIIRYWNNNPLCLPLSHLPRLKNHPLNLS